jgi:hypothetical protein
MRCLFVLAIAALAYYRGSAQDGTLTLPTWMAQLIGEERASARTFHVWDNKRDEWAQEGPKWNRFIGSYVAVLENTDTIQDRFRESLEVHGWQDRERTVVLFHDLGVEWWHTAYMVDLEADILVMALARRGWRRLYVDRLSSSMDDRMEVTTTRVQERRIGRNRSILDRRCKDCVGRWWWMDHREEDRYCVDKSLASPFHDMSTWALWDLNPMGYWFARPTFRIGKMPLHWEEGNASMRITALSIGEQPLPTIVLTHFEIDNVDPKAPPRPQVQLVPEEDLLPEDNVRDAQSVYPRPVFMTGNKDLLAYIDQNMRYPEAEKAAGIQGKVHLEFIVEADGRITEVSVRFGRDQ